MKRLIAAAIAFTLLGSTAALADGWHGRESYDHRGYDHDQSDNAGPLIAAGLGIAALAIIASQHDHHHHRRDYYGRYYGDSGYYRHRDYHENYRSYRDRSRERDHRRWNRDGDRRFYGHD